jgi:hypothetical protein
VWRRKVERGTEGDDTGRIDLTVTAVIVLLDVVEIDGLAEARRLVEVAQIVRQIRVVGDAA